MLTGVRAGRIRGAHVSGRVFLQQAVRHQARAALQEEGLRVILDAFEAPGNSFFSARDTKQGLVSSIGDAQERSGCRAKLWRFPSYLFMSTNSFVFGSKIFLNSATKTKQRVPV